MERRLGRGLGSLLGGGAEEGPERHGVSEIELTNIEPNPFQPRKHMEAAALEELRDSIRNHGVLQPVVLRAKGSGYELIAGERRWRAARLAGLKRIPAVVRPSVSDDDMLELALVENVQRRDLDPIERAKGYQAMLEGLGVTQDEVARKVGLKRATIANHIRLLELPPKVQEAVGKNLIGMGHARALLGLGDSSVATSMLEQVVRQDLSVRDVERMVRDKVRADRRKPQEDQTPDKPTWVSELERRLENRLGTKVSILNGKGFKGRIVIDYYTQQDLDRVTEAIAPRPRLG